MSLAKLSPLLSAGLIASSAAFAQAADRPNILLILVDDLGYGDLSIQGSTDLQTPNIDRLIRQGVRFTNFHANSPVSSPSRAALLTGRFPDQVGVPGVIRTSPQQSWGFLSPDAVLLPNLLKTASYHSAIIGKWHLGLTSPNTPNERGFDFFKGFLGDMMDDYYTHLRHGQNYMRHNSETITPAGHATDLFTDWAIDYINERQTHKTPYFLYLAYNAPHTPIQPPKEYETAVLKRHPGISPKRAKLVALIEHLDANIGRLLTSLEKNNSLENTLVIFASDNGGQADASANNAPFRGAKEDMYEGGIRVPAGIAWKNKIPAGSSTDKFALLSDLLPTIAQITGIPITHPIDGISILPTLLGQPQSTDNRIVHWVRREGGPRYGGQAYYATQTQNFKILQNTPWEPIQFFDLSTDPSEQNPLDPKTTHPEIYRQLFRAQTEHIRQSGSTPWQPPTP